MKVSRKVAGGETLWRPRLAQPGRRKEEGGRRKEERGRRKEDVGLASLGRQDEASAPLSL
jgi:hypothetical protein